MTAFLGHFFEGFDKFEIQFSLKKILEFKFCFIFYVFTFFELWKLSTSKHQILVFQIIKMSNSIFTKTFWWFDEMKFDTFDLKHKSSQKLFSFFSQIHDMFSENMKDYHKKPLNRQIVKVFSS